MENNAVACEKDISAMIEELRAGMPFPEEMKDAFVNLFVYLLVM